MLLLDARVQTCNWNDMLTYQTVNNAGVPQTIYLVDCYGEIPGTNVRAAALLYLTAGGRRVKIASNYISASGSH